MAVISPSIDLFLFSSIIAVVPSWYILNGRHSRRTNTRGAQPAPPDTPQAAPPPLYERVCTLLVHLHTVYIIYLLTVHWPPNVFSRLGLPLTTSSDRIRSALLQRAGLGVDAPLPRPLENLLTKLGNAEVRLSYVRFGQSVIQDCDHCKTADQYALFAAPGPVLQYVREVFLIGLLTAEYSGRSRWRTLGVVVLIAACLGEAWVAISTSIEIPRDGSATMMVHDRLYLLRHLLFFALPILIQWLPTSPMPPQIAPIIVDTVAATTVLNKRVQFLKYLAPTVRRDGKLREASDNAWSKQKELGGWIREDRGVWNVASQYIPVPGGKKEDSGAKETEAALRQRMRETMAELMQSIQPPPGYQ